MTRYIFGSTLNMFTLSRVLINRRSLINLKN
jgi:hypothetical protein